MIQDDPGAASGVIDPRGEWRARCADDGAASLAMVDLEHSETDFARPWRRVARGGVYSPHQVHDDPRTENRDRF